MAIVGGEAVREEQANGLICCVNKGMSATAQQWHISAALGTETGLEERMWSRLVWLWSPWRRRGTVDRKMSTENKIMGAATHASPSLHLSVVRAETLQTKRRPPLRITFCCLLFIPAEAASKDMFSPFISNTSWADTSAATQLPPPGAFPLNVGDF